MEVGVRGIVACELCKVTKLFEIWGKVVMPDVDGCGLYHTKWTEVAGRCVHACAALPAGCSFLWSPSIFSRQNPTEADMKFEI